MLTGPWLLGAMILYRPEKPQGSQGVRRQDETRRSEEGLRDVSRRGVRGGRWEVVSRREVSKREVLERVWGSIE